ncbi:MAG: TraB/GumN family protein [Saprospiraceae bacterium]|nr:TraB/GumN family protein [Saprospiraceae bacterium]
MGASRQSLLWQIDHPDLSAPSYLFGTMHLRRHLHLPILELARERLLSCTHFVAELDLSESQHLSVEKAASKDWTKELTPRKFEKLARIIRKTTRIPSEQLALYPPLFLVNILSSRILVPVGRPFHLDQFLWDLAVDAGKSTGGLETQEEQMAIYTAYSNKEQLQSLVKMTTNISAYRREMLRMNERYEQGAIQQLYQSTRKSLGGSRNALLFDRNRLMANRLAALLMEKTVFAGVGVAHLPGEKGMLRILKHKGFKLRPILPAERPEIP